MCTALSLTLCIHVSLRPLQRRLPLHVLDVINVSYYVIPYAAVSILCLARIERLRHEQSYDVRDGALKITTALLLGWSYH